MSKHIFMLFSTIQCPKIKWNKWMSLKVVVQETQCFEMFLKKSTTKIKSYLSSFSSQNPNLTKNPKRNTHRHSLESQITLHFEVYERSPILYEQVSRSRQLEFYSWENIYRSGISCRRRCLFLKNK